MIRPVVRAEDVSKYYRLGQIGGQTLREDVQRLWARWRRQPDPLSRLDSDSRSRTSIWALRDASFEVLEGEALGVIGRNGAGKSTLFKILSRITTPTRGEVYIRGRVASLLEVGTGFHAELTGRQNIYLNGAILGMRKKEIDKKLEEILAFAEIERFADTPVKRYSSGMYVRLGFAVAAHLEPEILLVDEVLAVGDLAFQKRCLGKMGEVSRSGRTVLFVSHNMLAVTSLCDRAIWLDEGRIRAQGRASDVVAAYVNASTQEANSLEEQWVKPAAAPGNDLVRLRRIAVVPQTPDAAVPFAMETPFRIDVEFWNQRPGARLHVTLVFYTDQEIPAFTTGSAVEPEWRDRPLQVGLFSTACFVPGHLLNSGGHRIVVYVIQGLTDTVFRYESHVRFDIVDVKSRAGGWFGREPGVVQPLLRWRTEYLGDGTP